MKANPVARVSMYPQLVCIGIWSGPLRWTVLLVGILVVLTPAAAEIALELYAKYVSKRVRLFRSDGKRDGAIFLISSRSRPMQSGDSGASELIRTANESSRKTLPPGIRS